LGTSKPHYAEINDEIDVRALRDGKSFDRRATAMIAWKDAQFLGGPHAALSHASKIF
jgi:hypothetical protein